MDWNHSPTVKRWVIIGGAFLLALILLATCAVTRTDRANAAELPPSSVITSTSSASIQGAGTEETDGLAAEGTSTRRCWYYTDTYTGYNGAGGAVWKAAFDVEWCGRNGKVVDVVFNICYSKGGAATYDGCHKQRGALGYPSLRFATDWKYHIGFDSIGLVVRYTPRVVFTVYPAGGITGTWYSK